MRAPSWLRLPAIAPRSHASGANDDASAIAGANEAAEPRAQAPVRRWFRRQSASERSRWARRALDWPLVNYLEGAVWLLVAVTLGVSYYGSYDNLVDVLGALGYAIGPAHVVPIALDAPLTCSVIGQFLLARWKSPAPRRWRLFAVTAITAPLSLAGNALHGALVFETGGHAHLDLSLLDLQRLDVWIRLVAAMVPAIGIILAVAVTELVLRERARLEELRETEHAAGEEVAAEGSQPSETATELRSAVPPRSDAKHVDPRVLRVARAGGDWRRVATATGLGEHGAKRALTAARKQLAASSQAAMGPGANDQATGVDADPTAGRPLVLTGRAADAAAAAREA